MVKIKTELIIGGRKFELEFDTDSNSDDLKRAIAGINALNKLVPVSAPARIGKPDVQDVQDVNFFRVTRVVISGTKADPKVEMFDSNPRLKFPVIKAPFDIFESCYTGSDDVSKYKDIGEEFKVSWRVYWVVSKKDEKYKDLNKVVVDDDTSD